MKHIFSTDARWVTLGTRVTIAGNTFSCTESTCEIFLDPCAALTAATRASKKARHVLLLTSMPEFAILELSAAGITNVVVAYDGEAHNIHFAERPPLHAYAFRDVWAQGENPAIDEYYHIVDDIFARIERAIDNPARVSHYDVRIRALFAKYAMREREAPLS